MEDLVEGDSRKWAIYKAYRDGLDEIRTWDSNSEVRSLVRSFVIPTWPPAPCSWPSARNSAIRRWRRPAAGAVRKPRTGRYAAHPPPVPGVVW